MPVGVRIGTFVHQVLQDTDFTVTRLDTELEARSPPRSARRELEIGDQAAVVAGLQAAIETPLGPALGDLRLRDLAARDRLDELQFELPLVGGETPTGRLTLTAIGEVIRKHTAPDDPLSGYAERLQEPGLRQSVRGYLTGTIDVVARVMHNGGEPGLPCSTTRRTGSARSTASSAHGTIALRPSRQRCSELITRCRDCCTRWRCTATCAGVFPGMTRGATSRACSTCSRAG